MAYFNTNISSSTQHDGYNATMGHGANQMGIFSDGGIVVFFKNDIDYGLVPYASTDEGANWTNLPAIATGYASGTQGQAHIWINHSDNIHLVYYVPGVGTGLPSTKWGKSDA